jgi:gliding motility-associated-like protein
VKKYIFFLSLFLAGLVNTNLYGQGTNCLGATPICSGAPTTFPAVNGGTVPAGNNYGCLGAQPNPSWFTLTVGSSGAITINQTAPCDQDYAVWGPFNSLSAACAGLTAAPVSCNFSAASGNTFTLPPATAGQIFIMLFTNFGGCTGNVNITESAGGGSLTCVPVCAVTASNLGPYCSGTTITLNATAATGATGYAWTGPNGFTATGQNVTIPNCTAAMAGVYTVTATGAATCTGSTTVVVNPTPTMNPTTNSPVCVGSPLTLCSGAPAGALVAWTGPAYAALNPCPTIASATAAMTGNYTVTVLLNGCQVQQILPVVVNPAPTITPVSPITLCSGATVPAQAFTGTPAAATFAWTNNQPGIGLAASGNGGLPSFVATNNGATAVTATISVVPQLGTCNGPASNFSIIVNPAPTITTPASNVFCEGATVPPITWTTSSPTGTVAWTNNNTATGMGASGTGTIPTFTASQVTTQTISTITATPSQGACVGTPVTFNLTVNNAPSATITDIGPICSNVGFQTLVAATPGGVWSGPGIINTSSGLFNPLSAGAGTTPTITYTLNLPNQCPASDVTTIQIISVPVANAGVNQSVCQGQTVNLSGSFTNSNTGNETFAWTPTTNLTNTTTLTPTYTANSTQTYILTVTSGICTSTDNVVVTMLPQSNATINAAGPYCADVAPVVLIAAQTGGTWSGPGITNASTGAFNPALANVGPNTITYSIGGSCPSSDTQLITIYAVPNGAITPAGPYCQSALPVTLTAATPGGTWSGTGINNAATGSFGSTTLAASTYAITYTTSGNCPRTFNQNIVVNANTNATITAAGPFCQDDAAVILTAAQTGGTWSGPGITNASSGAFNPANTTAVNNTVTYSIGGPCPSTDTQIIVVNSLPDGTITPVGPFCQSSLPFTLTAASPGGTWSGTGINNASTGSFGSATLAASTYTVTYNTGGNCPQVFTETIVVNANVDATITPQPNICADAAPIIFVAADLGGVWSGNGITNAATGAFNPASVIPNVYTITYTISGACPDFDTETIEVYEVFDGTITPAGPFCQSELPVTLISASTGGTWTGNGINNAANGSFGSNTLAANSYPITYTTGGSCPRVFNETIIVNANVDATISNVAPLCADVAAFNLTAVDPGGTWSGVGITDAVLGTFDPSVVGNTTETITYTIPGACSSSDTQDITVYPVYDGTITSAGPFCQADLPITLTAGSTGGTWSGTGINNASTGSFGSSTLAANTYIITYTTQGNCSEVNTTTIVVNANVDATISAVADVCNDAPAFNMSSVDAGGTWSGQGVSVTGTFTPNSVTPNTYTITYSIGGACPDSDTQDIVVLEVLDGTITPAGPFCQNDLPQTLAAASAGGTWSGTGINNAATGAFGAANTPAGNYSITYTTPGACSNSFNQVVQVVANLDATIGAAGPFCEDDSPFNLTAASAGGVWSGTGAITAGGQISPSTLGAGPFTFNYNIDNNGCLSSDNIQVTVNALPQPSFTTSTTNGCSPLSVTFTNTSNPLGSSCVWYVNGAPAGTGNSYSETFTGSSCEDIGIMITDAAGCSQSITMTDVVCVNPNPSASFSWTPIQPMLGGTVSFENTSIGGTTYTWDINGQGASGESVSYNVPSVESGEFQACLEVVGPGGCMDAQCYTVVLSAESYIFVPNSFTPDADGTNDVFAPIIAGLTTDYRYAFRVYDRWGDVIFETNDPYEVWTGNVHGGNYYAQPDAYVYEITLQLRAGEAPFRKVGSIVLIR